jgi:hypothetical protein
VLEFGPRMPSVVDPDGGITHLHHDQLGSTRIVTDTTGVVTGSALRRLRQHQRNNRGHARPRMGRPIPRQQHRTESAWLRSLNGATCGR